MAAWRASLPMPGSAPPPPRGGLGIFVRGRPHPMAVRSPTLMTQVLETRSIPHPMSSLRMGRALTAPMSVGLETSSSSSALAVAALPAASSIMPRPSLKRATPPVNYTARGDKRRGLEIARDPGLLGEAVAHYKREIKSAGDTSDDNARTWSDFHQATCWTRFCLVEPVPMLPLTPLKIMVVGSVFKGSGYRSTNKLHVGCEAPAHHIRPHVE